MASSSSAHALKYDVFLSFRGEDTRNTFTSHLHAALVQKKIKTYIDYELVRGDEFGPALLEAIEGSKSSVVILSQHYASSTWCLDELAHILECKERHGQIVIPIFYRIDPSHVRHQGGSYADAFLQHEERFKDMTDKLLKWRDALTKVSKLSGFDSHNIGLESELVDVVVKDIVIKLSRECSSDFKGLIGIESRIQKLESLLCNVPQSVSVRTLGVWGMGGIGKTTLADAVFNRLSSQFEASYFLANVRERSDKHGLFSLRNELVCNLLKDESLRIGTPSIGSTFIKKSFCRTKVLVVLDDVNDVSQLEILIGDQVQFGPGSRIIITTRDMHQLREMQQLQRGAEHDVIIYMAEELDLDEAVQLFHLNDPEETSCRAEYTEIVKMVLHYAAGIPLALKIWGSLFRRCRSKQERDSFLKKLKRFPEKKLQNVYRMSYDALGENEREIFLYIACFHKGHGIDGVIEQMNACGLSGDTGVNVLVDMSLISIKDGWSIALAERTCYIWMHDVIQEMGWAIVHEEHPAKPGKRSRLFSPEDVCHVLIKNKGTERVQSISLNLSQITNINLTAQAFENMCNLKLLKFYCEDSMGYPNWKQCGVHIKIEDLKYLPDSLIHLSWPAYPLNHLPSTFSAENLTELSMPGSQLHRLWDEGQEPRNLKRIDLSYSTKLVEVPDLSMSLMIERINLQGCKGMVEVPSYFQYLHKLTWLNLSDCLNLSVLSVMPTNMVWLQLGRTAIEDILSSVWSNEKLVKLDVAGCKCIKDLPNCSWKMYSLSILVLSGTSIEGLPSSIECLSGLEHLWMNDCKRFTSLPTSICKLKSLQSLVLTGCSSFENFPEILEPMELLDHLVLAGTKFKELPSLINNIVGHQELALPVSRSYSSVPNSILPPSSVILWSSMSNIDLKNCIMVEEIPDCIFSLNMLSWLDVSGTMIRSIPSTIIQASRLRTLWINDCKRLESLPELPCLLHSVNASGCTRLKTVSWSTTALAHFLNMSTDRDRVFYVLRSFYKCRSLDESARRNIMNDVHLRNAATDFIPELKYDIMCPGNEIPKWVSYQMEEAAMPIDITLPLHWSEDANFLGLAFCVVVNLHEVDDMISCVSEAIWNNGSGERHTYQSRSRMCSCTPCDDSNSDHLVAWYDSLQEVRSSPCTNAIEASFHFYARSMEVLDKKHQCTPFHFKWAEYKVERCGVGFVYAEGPERNIVEATGSESSVNSLEAMFR